MQSQLESHGNIYEMQCCVVRRKMCKDMKTNENLITFGVKVDGRILVLFLLLDLGQPQYVINVCVSLEEHGDIKPKALGLPLKCLWVPRVNHGSLSSVRAALRFFWGEKGSVTVTVLPIDECEPRVWMEYTRCADFANRRMIYIYR